MQAAWVDCAQFSRLPMPRASHVLHTFALLALVAAPGVVPAQADTTQVLAALTKFFDAARVRDTLAVRAAFDSAARLTLLRPAPNGEVRVVALAPQQFVQAVASGSGLDEPIRNAKVHVDGDLAVVWAEYQVRANGAVTHCGYDAFQMVRREGTWKILAIADTFRREGCGALWPR